MIAQPLATHRRRVVKGGVDQGDEFQPCCLETLNGLREREEVFPLVGFGPLGEGPCAPVGFADSDEATVPYRGIQGRQGRRQSIPDELAPRHMAAS
jgi:hypothetical protein